MDLLMINDWIAKSGLSTEEVATIQPIYNGPTGNYYYFFEKEYAIASSILGGMNLATTTINLATINDPDHSRFIPYLGLTSGATATGLGIIKIDEGLALSMLNIGLGTATMFISAYRLLDKEKSAPKMTSWNIYNFQTTEDQVGLGLSFKRRF